MFSYLATIGEVSKLPSLHTGYFYIVWSTLGTLRIYFLHFVWLYWREKQTSVQTYKLGDPSSCSDSWELERRIEPFNSFTFKEVESLSSSSDARAKEIVSRHNAVRKILEVILRQLTNTWIRSWSTCRCLKSDGISCFLF